jgi:hypothetical protein
LNNNTNNTGFGVSLSPIQIQYVLIGKLMANGTYYIYPGTFHGNELHTFAGGIPFTNKCMLIGYTLSASAPLAAGDQFQINLFNTTTPTTGGSGTQIGVSQNLTPSVEYVRVQNISSAFNPTATNPTNYLQVQLVLSGGLNGNGYAEYTWYLTLAMY